MFFDTLTDTLYSAKLLGTLHKQVCDGDTNVDMLTVMWGKQGSPVGTRVTAEEAAAGLAGAGGFLLAGDALRLQQQEVQRVRVSLLRHRPAQLAGHLQCLGLPPQRAVHLPQSASLVSTTQSLQSAD